jgi:hypothetical protein
MRQIYNVKVGFRNRWVMDERDGMVQRTERVMQPADTEVIKDPELGPFEVRKDGTFHVPDKVAEHFLRMPDWNEGPNPFFADAEADPAPVVTKVKKV